MRLELIFPLLLLQPSIRSRKTNSNTGDKNIEVPVQFEHSFTNQLGHAPTTEAGIALRQWLNYQGIQAGFKSDVHDVGVVQIIQRHDQLASHISLHR